MDPVFYKVDYFFICFCLFIAPFSFLTGLRYIGMDDLVNCGHCKETFHLLSRSDLKLERHLKYVIQ